MTTLQEDPARTRSSLRPAADLLLLIVLAALAGTALMALQAGGGTLWIDGAARSVAGMHDNEGLNRAMMAITTAGEEIVLLGAFGAIAVLAYLRRGARWGRFFIVVGLGSLVLDNLIKPLVGRPRPVFDQLVGGRGDSFPSGHVTATTALLFALAWYLTEGRTGRVRTAIWCAAAGGSLLMGASRVYLGVHWPTDVLAGSVLGAGWVSMCAGSQLGRSFALRPIRSWVAGGRMVPLLATMAMIGAACSPSSDPPAAQAKNAAPSPHQMVVSSYPYEVDIRPEDFVGEIDNTYLPLVPGTVFKLRGATEDGIEDETITVTDRTREVMGVTTTVVKDAVRVDGELAEFTYDWYAQDVAGNVWYFGEDTSELENGKVVSRHGSWEAGVDGALPGIIMNADPKVLDSYRQEYYAGEAEDMFWVVSAGETVTAPAGTYDGAIKALEFNPLEPKIIVEKFYAPGVGLVSERALSGGKEVVELLSVEGP